jgi:DNA-binding Xre family transcriptional regulator
MGWTTDTAEAIQQLLDERRTSYRTLAEAVGHSYNYWWQRLGTKRTALTLEDIEILCRHLGIDPRDLLSGTKPDGRN